MIYLLSQMLLITAVAVIVGLAFGWLIHRSTYSRRLHQLQQTVRRQRAQVSQAQSDVNMLNDDYDELKRTSQDQISTLHTANQQIPVLLNNLEQSQLLAQQNMKRYESRERNFSTEKQRLEEQLAALNGNAPTTTSAAATSATPSVAPSAAAPSAKIADSLISKEPSAFSLTSRDQGSNDERLASGSQAKSRLQGSTDERPVSKPQEQSRFQRSSDERTTGRSPVKSRFQSSSDERIAGEPQLKSRFQDSNSKPATDTTQAKSRSQGSRDERDNDARLVPARSPVNKPEADTETPRVKTSSRIVRSARANDALRGAVQTTDNELDESSLDLTQAAPVFSAAESISDDQLDGSSHDMTQVPPVFSATELDDDDLFEESAMDMTQAAPSFAVGELDNDPFDQVMEVDGDFQLDFDQTNDTASQTALDDTASPNRQEIDTATLDVLDIGAELEDEELSRVKGELAAERALQGSSGLDDLQPRSQQDSQNRSTHSGFTPSKTADDLQQIFGIGPLTEKALNELGITSYSQLAQLEKHDIQHIADALEIGPGRIERDNWVGNARRQLEDVLEQL